MALIDKLTAIADAIRGKTGKTEEMTLDQMPLEIASIVSSGGGGSLPAGAYWEVLDIPYPATYNQKWVVYNGVLYAFVGTSAVNCPLATIYKYSAGAWTTVVSGLSVHSMNQLSFKEYNGKMHLTINESTTHYVFDGTSLTAKNAYPAQMREDVLFVQDGKLKAYSYYTGIVYIWDEVSDTWTVEATIGKKNDYYFFHNVGENVYAIYNRDVYSYDGGVATKVGSLPATTYCRIGCNGKLYFTIYLSYRPYGLYEYDVSSNQYRQVAITPNSDSYQWMFEYGGKICVINPSCSNSFGVCALHEVTE